MPRNGRPKKYTGKNETMFGLRPPKGFRKKLKVIAKDRKVKFSSDVIIALVNEAHDKIVSPSTMGTIPQ